MWLVVVAKSVSWLGDEVALVAMTLRLQAGGHGAAAVAALLIANLLPIVLLSGVVGRLLDRRDNRSLLIASSVVQASVCSVLAFTSAPWAVLGLVAALGAGQAINAAAWQALLPEIVGRQDLPAAVGRVTAGTTLAGVVAPALGGLLTGWYGARVPLLLDAATFAAITGAALLMSTRRVVPAAAETGERQQGGVRIVWGDALLRPLFVLLGVFVLLASMVNVVEVFLIRGTLGASTVWYGLAGAALSMGALTGAVLGGRLRGPDRLARGFLAAAMVLAVGLAAIGVVPAVAWVLPCGFVAGAGNGVLVVALGSLVMGRARDAERGRVGALLTGVSSGTQLVAYVAAGLLAVTFTPREIFVAAGVLGLAAPVVLGRSLVRGAASPSPLAEAPADVPAAA